MEKIQSHEIKDIWRIQEGLLVEVHKYKTLGYHIHSKKSEKRVKGCKGLTILTEDYTDSYYKKTIPKGTLFYYSSPVEPVTDRNLFKIEIKSSGGSILGTITETEKVLRDLESLIKQY
ncbi:hypothetical protein [Paenibacillus oleatilyticus]|uniref:hypothetical protein n=1 Tax=Paenibacillus oleatilyticus TaxID=2594886 RepID=UPI001C1F6DF1|nr:hypothetical protein [Paenibacillus oleatilyticus]MBU7316006.1 hypothetical protein [Paenibacillus oleatilyticus]